MGLKTSTVQTIMNELAQHKKGITAEQLVENTGYALPTIRAALATGKTMGIVGKVPAKTPAIYLPIDRASFEQDEVKIIQIPVEIVVEKKVPTIPFIDKAEQDRVKELTLDKTKLDKTNLLHAILIAYHEVQPEKKLELLTSLYNMAEFLRQRDFSGELQVSDINIEPLRSTK